MAVILFFTEVFIAVFVRDTFLRPYGGDFLVVIFLYCLLKSFFRIPLKKALFGVLLFAFFIEGLQYLGLTKIMGLEGNSIAVTVLGNHFEWLDMLLYSLGALSVFLLEKVRVSFSRNSAIRE